MRFEATSKSAEGKQTSLKCLFVEEGRSSPVSKKAIAYRCETMGTSDRSEVSKRYGRELTEQESNMGGVISVEYPVMN